jgi:hypothetical protein
VRNRGGGRKGKGAKKERSERLKGFLKTHAGKNNIGVTPFFVSLHTALRLQTGEEGKGGAGERRVEWEVDDGEHISFVLAWTLISCWEIWLT